MNFFNLDNMKKTLLVIAFVLLLFTTCEKDDYETGIKAPGRNDDLVEKVTFWLT